VYYRLSVFPVELPPLRQRKEDIPPLAEHFLRMSARKLGRATPRLTLAAVQRLQQYDWPGNVRELQHVLERAVITSSGGRINVELPTSPKAAGVAEAVAPEADRVRTDAKIRQLEADNIRAALKAAGGTVSGPGGAAQVLGMKPTTLASRKRGAVQFRANQSLRNYHLSPALVVVPYPNPTTRVLASQTTATC
jgi:transcriptional regulator with GAF, ATPase, and Fis domain